ncbi:hypothetical protein [Brevundimonas sp. A19_0]|uniref:hypothetical protein n=1 Tax=Brevundimonas sp. A19_0 TaxID=2821087 RepID=UPI001ADD3F63|nr:hypothetical protein [Brevundimonas sp. A19_0]MBO9502507.1 hypothetical protein [Brevundimonas sp. A19_0]
MTTLVRAPDVDFPTGYPTLDDFPPVSMDGVQAWYEFDEGSGTTIIDKSGNGNHATITGTPIWTPEGLQLDGATNRVSTSVTGTEEFDWIFLLKPLSGGSAFQVIAGDYHSFANLGGAFAYYLRDAETFRQVYSQTDGSTVGSTTVTLPDDAAPLDAWKIVSFQRRDTGPDVVGKVELGGGGAYVTGKAAGKAPKTGGNEIILGDNFQANAGSRFKGILGGAVLCNRPQYPDEYSARARYVRQLAARRGISFA